MKLWVPISLALGMLYWMWVDSQLGVTEPWDSEHFWSYYLPALPIGFLIGFVSRQRSVLIGGIFVLAMLPVMALQSGVGPLIAVGILLLLFLSAPAAVSSWVGGHLRQKLSGPLPSQG